MRYKLYFNLENEHFPLDYRRSIISFIKLSLSEYNKEYFDKYYKNNDNIIKPYTFAVFFYGAKFEKNEICIKERKFELNISIADYETALILYNSFNHQKNKKFSLNNNSFTLNSISVIPEKVISSENVNIKFLSPLVVRNRNRETKKDYYVSYSHEKFLDTLKTNIKVQLEEFKKLNLNLQDFDLVPIKPQKTVVKFYEKQIECSFGEYELKADRRVIEFLYKCGMGSKHSAGFGMFKIL